MGTGVRQADVVLRGYGGYNTRWALHILEDVFPPDVKPAPHLVTLFWGANDAAIPDRLRFGVHMFSSSCAREHPLKGAAHLKKVLLPLVPSWKAAVRVSSD